MKKHIGIFVALAGVLLVYPLSTIIGPLISKAFLTRLPDGTAVSSNVSDGIRGPFVCWTAGFVIFVVGITIEVIGIIQRKRKPSHASNLTVNPGGSTSG